MQFEVSGESSGTQRMRENPDEVENIRAWRALCDVIRSLGLIL